MTGRGRCFLNTMLLLLAFFGCATLRYAHAYGPGLIHPSTAEVAVGGTVNITCRMNPSFFPGRNASDLRFINAYTNESVSGSHVSVLNATTIVYTLRNATEQSTTYLCKSGQDAIMYMKLYVGTVPNDVQNFRCRNYDYEYMVCNFTQPRNHVLTQYNLSYYLHSPKYVYNMFCNYDAKPLVVCNTTLNDKPRVRFEHFTLNFLLRAANALGNHQQRFNFSTLDISVPTTTDEWLRLWNKTTDTLKISWDMRNYEYYRGRGLQWHIVVQPRGHASVDFSSSAVIEHIGRSEIVLTLVDLPFAYYEYTLSVRARVQGASSNINDGDADLWSVPFVYNFWTAARLPDRPPRTDVGSFYISSNEMYVHIYWEQLQPHEYNGDAFCYAVNVVRNGLNVSLEPTQMELNSAKFEWHKDSHYRFEIRSQNHIGVSKEYSTIEIPVQSSRSQRNHTPPAVHSIYHATNNSYTLTWLPPREIVNLQDFTIFWCSSKRATQTECQGSIYFQHVDSSVCNFTTAVQPLQQEYTLIFAVSANYIDYNTGMHWTPCTLEGSSDLIRMEPEAQAITATSINVQWMLERICLSVISGYKIFFCELMANSTDCLPATTRSDVLSKNLKKYNLTGLRPYTTYRVQMLMYSNLKESKLSEPIFVQTLEAAPMPPRQLQIPQNKVKRNSAVISWMPPLEANGRIRYYIIQYNEHSVRFNASDDWHNRFEYELQNLSSYTDYRVHVSAYTIAKSLPSNEIQLHTLIGAPSMPGETFVIRDKESSIEWSRPAEPAGRLEYYELAVTQYSEDEMIRRRVSIIIGKTSCRLTVPACVDQKQRLVFEVRAINAALLTHEVPDDDEYANNRQRQNAAVEPTRYYRGNEDLECIGGSEHDLNMENYKNPQQYRLYYSEWRRGPTYGCSVNAFDKSLIYIIGITFVMSLLVMAVTYVARKKIIKMSSIECTLPPGLAIYLTKDGVCASGVNAQAHHKAAHNSYGNVCADNYLHHVHNNEKHHLLSTAGNDSGYLGDHHPILERNISTSSGYSNGCIRTTSECSSADSMLDSNGSCSMEHELDDLDMNGCSLAPTLAANAYHNTLPRITEEYVPSAVISNTNNGSTTNSGYVNPTKILNWKDTTTPDAELHPVAVQQPPAYNSDYVAVNTLNNVVAPTVSGYVQPSQLPKLFGATPSTSMPPSNILATLTKERQPAAISGYVTQRDLNQFSQQQCNSTDELST